MSKPTPKPLAPLAPRRRRTRPLGPFSYLLMCTLTRLPVEHCYGAELEHQLSAKYQALIDLAQVYVALRRLDKDGHITGKKRPSPTGENYEVVTYTITAKGREALAHSTHFYKMLAASAPD